MSNSTTLRAELIDVLCEFLEAAVHTVLHARNLYNQELFERRKLFNTFVRKARHPQLNQYISAVISNLRPLLEQQTLRQLCVVFKGADSRPLERVTIAVQVCWSQLHASLTSAELESNLGSALLKLQFVDHLLQPLPPGSTFELLALTSSREHINMQLFSEDSAHELELPQPVGAHALKSVRLGQCVGLQVLLEEGALA